MIPMPMTDQDMLPANDLGDWTPRGDNEEILVLETDSALRDAHEEMTAPETHNAPVDAMLNDCRVEMVPLDAIYAGSDPYDDNLHDDLIKALAHSISLIGLQNPICVVANDIPDHTAPYRLVSGRKRYAAFLQLERTTIPAHILSYAETDSEQYVRKALATTEENLVRKHYALIELCALVGQAKELYERIHPTTQKGKAKKPKSSGTELFPAPVPQPLAYLDVAAQQLGKSRVTVWKYITIYTKLIQSHHYEFIQLKQCEHPILTKLEDLLALAQSDDLEVLTRLLCGQGPTPDDRKSKPRSLQEAQKRLEEYLAKEARTKDQSPVSEKEKADQSKKAEDTERETAPPQPEEKQSAHFSSPHAQSEAMAKPAADHDLAGEEPQTAEASQTDLQDIIAQLAEMVDQHLRAWKVFERCDVRILKRRNRRGRNRLLIAIQE